MSRPWNPEPLYLQIEKEVRRRASDGTYPPGMLLPSFRDLAAKLLVSVITVKRAYEDLEQEGVIVRRQGLGTFIAPGARDAGRSVKWERARGLLREAIREAREAGIGDGGVLRELRLQLLETARSEERKGWKAARSGRKG